MKLNEYIIQDGKKLRLGYTTGSCALGATTAACLMLEKGEDLSQVKIDTPAGIPLTLDVEDIQRGDGWVSCCVQKDAGDDPDATDGLYIYSKVSRREDGKIILDADEGIGRIQRKGLFGEIGDPAINPVPKKNLLEALEKYSKTGLTCLLSIPGGEEVAKRTFNRYIGIEGGLSILGTKGLVYPMSADALLKSIYMEMDMIKEENGLGDLLLTPGNYGKEVVEKANLKIPVVEVSNYIGDALKYAYSLGFRKITLIGHIGKFSKLAIGIFQTHSSTADTRMESFIYYLALMGAPRDFLEKIDQTISGEQALDLCLKEGYGEIIPRMEEGCSQRIKKYLRDEDLDISTYIYSMNHGVSL